METLRIILELVLGCSTLVSFILYGKANRRIKDAEAQKAEADADSAEIARLHTQIDHQQKSLNIYIDLEKKNAGRIAEQNKYLDGKTEQIRNLTQQLIESEHGRNADKDKIARLTAEISDLRLLVEHYKMWHCRKSDCDSRVPPNKKLNGLKYEPPKRAVSAVDSTEHQ